MYPQKEDKSQQHKVRKSITDYTSVQAPPPRKASSPDALKESLSSLATISNINIDITPQEEKDVLGKQVQRSQLAVSQHHQPGNEHVTHRVYEDGKRGRKLDPPPSPSPVKLSLKSVSGVGTRGGDKMKATNGLLDIQPQAMPGIMDTFSVFGEKRMSDVDAKNDTMDLLKEAEMQNPKLEEQKSTHTKRSTHRSNRDNTGVAVEINMDKKNDTVILLKSPQTENLHTSDIQVSAHGSKVILLLFSQYISFSVLCYFCVIVCLCRTAWTVLKSCWSPSLQ